MPFLRPLEEPSRLHIPDSGCRGWYRSALPSLDRGKFSSGAHSSLTRPPNALVSLALARKADMSPHKSIYGSTAVRTSCTSLDALSSIEPAVLHFDKDRALFAACQTGFIVSFIVGGKYKEERAPSCHFARLPTCFSRASFTTIAALLLSDHYLQSLIIPTMSQIKVGEYLFLRLKELGVKTCFGVPGGETKNLFV